MQRNISFMTSSTLSNGAQVATRTMPHAESVALAIFVNTGSRDEAAHQAGIAHALEHMVFKGTDRLSVHQFAEQLDDLGGNANAFTTKERTCFHMHVLHEDWQKALALLSDMLLAPALPEDEWQREREVVFAEMGMVEDNPDEWVYEQHISQVFAGHSMAKPVLGSKASLSALCAQDLRDYLHANYRGERVLIAAAGRIEHQDLLDWVEQSAWTEAEANRQQVRCAPSMRFGQSKLARQMEQAHFLVSWPSLPVTSPQKPVAWVANQLLGGSMSSILFREIREKRGLAYSVGSHLSAYTDAGLLSISGSTMPEQLDTCLAVLQDTLRQVCEGVPQAMVARAKRQLTVQFRMGMDAVESSVMQLGALLDEGKVDSPLVWAERVQAVETAQVRRFLSDCLQADGVWTVATPSEAKAAQSITSC